MLQLKMFKQTEKSLTDNELTDKVN